MGKLIICNGKQADKPFFFKLTNTYVYSIEELCYYLYQNIDVITNDQITPALSSWMEEELELKDRADKLMELMDANAGLKDLIVCILCSADYYSEAEIKQLLRIIDETDKLTPFEKKKKKADNYLSYRQFAEAEAAYENIISSKEAEGLSSEEYGNLMHNLAYARLHTVGLSVAATSFKEAYDRNQNQESLRQYIITLMMSKQGDKLKEEVLNYGINTELYEQFQEELKESDQNAKTSEEYQVINQLIEFKESGKITKFYQIGGALIGKWKQDFRQENSEI